MIMMMRTMCSLAPPLAASALAGCGIREAHIAMPSHLAAATERLELRGMGGGTRGDFRLAGMPGSFTRSAERLGIFDPLLVRNSGGGSFRLEGARPGEDLAGRCRFREREVNVGNVSVTPDRLMFRCGFARGGMPIAAELVLEDPKGALGTLHGRAERTGILYFEGQRIAIRSIHRDQGGGLPSPHAIGYMFEAGGREIGAVDLNGVKTVFAPRDPAAREAVIAASLALSIFWDPAI
jgi:hypothetical protein